jgi:hypothetical protein
MFHARPLHRLAASVLTAAVAAALGGAATAAAEAPAAPSLSLRALTGPKGGTLDIRAETATFAHVQVKLYAPDAPEDAEPRTINLKDVDLVSGATTIELGPLERGSRVVVQTQSRGEDRILVSRSSAVAKLRPDVTVAAVRAPAQTLSVRPVDVEADLTELNDDTAAAVDVVLMLGPTPVAAAQRVDVAAGDTTTVVFEDVSLPAANATRLEVVVEDAAPYETDETNNSGEATIDVTEHELTRSNVLVPSLGGYGAQFNNHVYAPITPWPAGLSHADFEAKARALQPHIVRIFYNDNWEENRDGTHPEAPLNYESFVKSVRLAQESGATIQISFQRLTSARATPGASMARFANALEDLVRNHGLTNVRWAEVGNEPNSTGISLAEYDRLVRLLDVELRTRGLRDQIRLMGGGLVELAGNPSRNHYEWMKWIAENMSDVFDAWAEHAYWNYNDTGRLEYRLRDTWHLLYEVLPPEQRKPIYMMEFGIRGLGSCPGKPNRANTYYAADPACPEIWRTNIAGFQQLWFAIGSAQLGYAGAAKWDAFWGVYDFTISPPQVYWAIGPAAEGSPLLPTYHAMSLLFHTTEPGWQVVGVRPWDDSDWSVPAYGVEGHSSNDTAEKELAAYAGANGELTVLGLDTNGRALNGVSADGPARYSIGGLPPSTSFTLALWNAAGDGLNTVAATVVTNAAGVARFEVPLHAAFALTTVPVS